MNYEQLREAVQNFDAGSTADTMAKLEDLASVVELRLMALDEDGDLDE